MKKLVLFFCIFGLVTEVSAQWPGFGFGGKGITNTVFVADTTYRNAQLALKQSILLTRNATAPQSGTLTPTTATDTLKAQTLYITGETGFGTPPKAGVRVDINGEFYGRNYGFVLRNAANDNFEGRIITSTDIGGFTKPFYFQSNSNAIVMDGEAGIVFRTYSGDWNEVMRMTATGGNMGIGITPPATGRLSVKASNAQLNVAEFYRYGTTGAGTRMANIDTTGAYNSGEPKMWSVSVDTTFINTTDTLKFFIPEARAVTIDSVIVMASNPKACAVSYTLIYATNSQATWEQVDHTPFVITSATVAQMHNTGFDHQAVGARSLLGLVFSTVTTPPHQLMFGIYYHLTSY